VARAKTKEEKLFAAAVLRRTFELRGEAGGGAFKFVYDGVLRDLGLTDDEVRLHLEQNGAAVDAAIGRGGTGRG
jgi:hypothetical protein